MIWDERYDQDHYIYGTEPNEFLAAHYQLIPKGTVLCVAEGEGRNSVFLAGKGYEATGVDSSKVGLTKAQKLAEQKGVTVYTVVADLAHYAIEPNHWDGVVSIFCHLPPDVRKDLHRRIVAGLKPGGVLILEAYTPKQLMYKTGGPPVPELTMEKDTILEELQGLEILHAEELDREVIEGTHHHGKGAVLQMIARKPAP